MTAATSRIIQRSLNSGGPWTTIATVTPAATTYQDTGLTNGTEYFYRVIGVNAQGNSPPSNVASAIPTGGTGLLTDLVHWWEMDEASGTRADSHGSLDLPLAPTSAPVPSRNVIGGDGADFNGSTNWLRSAGVGTPGWNLGEFTVAAWVEMDNVAGSFRTFLSFGDFSTSAPPWSSIGFGFGYRQGVGFELFTGHGASLGQIQATTFGVASTATPYLVVAYFSDSANLMGISINGGAYQTIANGNGPINSVSSWRIDAARYKTSGPFMLDGGIARAAIWGRVLSAGDVTNLYNGGAGRSYSQL